MIQQNQIVRLIEPKSVKRSGSPEHFIVNRNGQEYRFKWGGDYRVSAHCDPDNKIGSLDSKGGYPLVHKEFANKHESKFNIIKTED